MNKTKHIARLTALTLAAALTPAFAAQDLMQTYQQALQDDPQLAAARAQQRADEEKLAQARSLFLPQIGVQGEASRVSQGIDYTPEAPPISVDKDLDYTSRSYGVQLTQPLFRLESFTVYNQAKILTSQSELQYGLARQDLGLRTAEAYFRVLGAQNVLSSYEAELKAIEQQLQRAKRAFEVGAGTITDVNDAQARFDLTQARRLQAMNDVRIAQEGLRRITGQPVGQLADVCGEFTPQPPMPASSAAWAEQAEQQNLQVQLAEQGFKLAQDEISRQRAQHFPKVDLVARYGRSYQSETQFGPRLDGDQGSVGVTLTMPLYAGGAISSQVREAQARKDVALEQVRNAKRGANLAAEQSYLSLAASLEQVRALEQALKSIRLNEESTRKGMELGLRTTLDVLNVQRERYAAERDLAAARYAYLQNYLRLQAAVGALVGEAPIQAVNQFLAACR